MTARSSRLAPLLLALLALFGQIALTTLPPAAMPGASGAAEAASLHICGAPLPGHKAPHHGGLACQLCPLCFSATEAAVLPAQVPVFARPLLLAASSYLGLRSVRAPPGRAQTTAFPRGPPIPA